ncbi:MAG: hypothetical protein WAX04_12610 [Oscillospiraceae bacterium]
MTNKKKMIIKISVWLLAFLILSTAISRSIYTKLLPEVEVYTIDGGTLSTTANVTGKVGYTNKTELVAEGDWKVKEVFAQNNSAISKGDTLFGVDITNEQLATKRLELGVIKIENQLNPEPSAKNEGERAETQAQLNIAQHELSMHTRRTPDENAIQLKKLNLAVAQLKNQQDAFDVSEDNSSDLRLKVKVARDDLSKMIADAKPANELDKQRLLIASLQEDLDYYYLTHAKESAISTQLETAQDELAHFIRNETDISAFRQEQLELAVMRLENQLKEQPVLSEQQKSELLAQLSIAKLEIETQKQSYPKDGKVIATGSGTVMGLNAKAGDSIVAGQQLFYILSEKSKPCIEWEMDLQEGDIYAINSEVTVAVDIIKGKYSQAEQVAALISKKKFDNKTNKWNFTAEFQEDVKLKETTIPKISLVNASENHRMIVPLSCIIEKQGGKFAVQTLEKKQGLFSEETAIREVKVEVIDKNNLYAAINGDELYWQSKIVQYASKPISEGAVVSVVN